MSATVSNIVTTVFGSKRIVKFDVALGAYTAGGISVTPASLGLRRVDIVLFEPGTDGTEYQYNYTSSVVQAYTAGGNAISNVTMSAPTITVTGAAVVVSGAITNTPIFLSSNSNTAILTKNAATNRTIPLATLLGNAGTSGAVATGPSFLTTTSQGALVEVSGISLATACHALAIGD